MKHPKNRLLSLEALEDRLTPSFNFSYVPTSDTWTVTQVIDNGSATIQVNTDLIVTDGAGSVTIGVASSNLVINMLDNSGDTVTVDLDTGITGNLTLNLKNGVRTADFTGATNTIGGNLSITAGTGAQTVNLSAAALFSAGGTANIDLGIGSDTVTADTGLSVGSTATLRNVNSFAPGAAVVVGGNLNFYANAENIANSLTLANTDVIGLAFYYSGGTDGDTVTLDGTTIGTSAQFSVSNGANSVTLTGGTVVGSNVTYTGGSGVDSFISDDATNTFGGSVVINTGTMGNDTVTLMGLIGGSSANITTGLGNDTVLYSLMGSAPSVTANLGGGTDTFTLDTLANVGTLRSLYIDFGSGVDSWINNYGAAFSFTATLKNLP